MSRPRLSGGGVAVGEGGREQEQPPNGRRFGDTSIWFSRLLYFLCRVRPLGVKKDFRLVERILQSTAAKKETGAEVTYQGKQTSPNVQWEGSAGCDALDIRLTSCGLGTLRVRESTPVDMVGLPSTEKSRWLHGNASCIASRMSRARAVSHRYVTQNSQVYVNRRQTLCRCLSLPRTRDAVHRVGGYAPRFLPIQYRSEGAAHIDIFVGDRP